MNFEIWGESDVGLKRTNNQDSFLIDREHNLFVVADGMGGHSGGEIASAMAVETVQEFISQTLKSKGRVYPRELISRAYREANDRIYKRSHEENPELRGMGTTMVLAFCYNETLYVANVGDSRAYFFSPPYLWQITEDHSLINEHLRAGLIQDQQIANFVGKNVITRSVGFEPDVNCDVLERKIQVGETLLLCSDGFSGMVAESRIVDLMLTVPLPKLAPRCIFEAKKNGGDDNITVLIISAVR